MLRVLNALMMGKIRNTLFLRNFCPVGSGFQRLSRLNQHRPFEVREPRLCSSGKADTGKFHTGGNLRPGADAQKLFLTFCYRHLGALDYSSILGFTDFLKLG